MQWPPFNSSGDLPVAIHKASLTDALDHFANGSLRRQALGRRLERIYSLARSTGKVRRFIIFGSFITTKPEPGDVDIFLIMEDDFNFGSVQGEAALVFDHTTAQNTLGASIFWIRLMAAIGGEDSAIADWQHKRDGTLRGLVELVDS